MSRGGAAELQLAGDILFAKPEDAIAFQTIALRQLQQRIGEANAAKGFHEEGDDLRARIAGIDVPQYLRNYYTARLALITTEVAESIEELRNGRQVDETYWSGGIGFETDGDVTEDESADANGNPRKPEGVPSEVADVVIRAFDFAHEAGFDLASIIAEKLAYNATRAHKHGRKF